MFVFTVVNSQHTRLSESNQATMRGLYESTLRATRNQNTFQRMKSLTRVMVCKSWQKFVKKPNH